MTSIVQVSDTAFTDATLPKLTRSPAITPGTQFRLDFTDAYTLNGLAAGAALTAGHTFKNMVDGAANAVTDAGVSSAITVAAGGLGLSVSSPGDSYAQGMSFPMCEFDMHDAGDHPFMVHLWAALDTSGQVAAPWVAARSGSTNAADVTSPIWGVTPGPLVLNGGGDGKTATGYIRGYGNAYGANLGSGNFQGSANLFSFSASAAGSAVYKNGVLVASGISIGASIPSMRSHATLTASANVSNGDTVTVNGTTITFVTSGATGAQVNIGADANASLAALAVYINANSGTLNARAERTTGQAANVLTVLHTGTGTLTLAESSASLTVSAITNPYQIRVLPRGIKGKLYAVAMDDLTASGLTPAQAAAAEYAVYRARLTSLGIS